MKNFLKKLVFSMIAMIIFFATIETGTRLSLTLLWGHEKLAIKWHQWAALVGWHPPRPGVINALGFHNKEVSPFKSKNVFRILVLGSSAVYGTDALSSGWPSYLERLLNQNIRSVKFEVWNGGISGGSSHEDVKQLLATVEFDPDLVIAYNGFNDTYAMHYSPTGYLARQPPYGFQLRLAEMRNFLLRHFLVLALFKKAVTTGRSFIIKLTHRSGPAKPTLRRASSKPGDIWGNSEKDAAKASGTKKILNIWDDTYVYEISKDQKVVDDFTSYYKRNLLVMHDILERHNIPLVIILQPNLAYSAVIGTVSPRARETLKKSTNILDEDWIQASATLYPGCVRAIKELNRDGILAYDFTDIFQGMEDQAFSDAVHQKDGYPKDLIAQNVRSILLSKKLIPDVENQPR